MAKSPDQFRQSATNKVQKNVQWSNTNFINIPSNSTTANELAAEKAKAQALENKHIALTNEKASLEGKHKNLNKTHANLKKAHDTLANEKASLEGKHNDLNKVYEDLKNSITRKLSRKIPQGLLKTLQVIIKIKKMGGN